MQAKQSPINYLYFFGAFGFLILLAASSIFTKENLAGSQFFFFLYALGQIVIEITLFVFLSLIIRRYLSRFWFAFFIGMTFLALVLHAFDFLMDRVLDLSFFEALNVFVLNESLENFIYLLDASGIPIWAWLIFFALLGSIPFIGYFIYQATERICQKKQMFLDHSFFFQAFTCLPLALLFWDYSASKVVQPDAYTAFIKSLPWKFTFLAPEAVIVSMPAGLKTPMDESAIAQAIEQESTYLVDKPNIYLFVVESLREDAITSDIAPHLHAFKMDNTHVDTAISNGNGTHISWFSIFHSQFPYHWEKFQKQWKMGSPALALLKKWGYQIRLYSSAQLGYYGMEELIFGQKNYLLDSKQTFHHAPPLNAADTDALALTKLQEDLKENPSLEQGQVFVIFWDSTHFDYSWPKNWTPKFTPIAQEFAYFQAFHSQKTIQHIKNRYFNALNYMDHLFGQFFASLPNKEEAIVVFTGDHGEEFFEHGHLFHNSHLTKEQTHVPLYFKFNKPIAKRKLASQMDIFPTICEYLSGKPIPFLEGNSLFSKKQWPFAITARFNAGLTPYEFSIHNGEHKMIAQFLNRKSLSDSKQIQIRSLRTFDDQSIHNPADSWVQSEFGPALEHLFPSKEESSF